MTYPPADHGQHGQHQPYPQAPPPYPQQGHPGGPGMMYRPATGSLPWGLGLLILIPIPLVSALIASIAMLIAGRSARHRGPLAEANGRHAANWGLTYLLLTVLLVGAHVLVLFVFAREESVSGFFPIGIPITLWLIAGVVHLVVSIIGLVKASKNQEYRGLGLPLLR